MKSSAFLSSLAVALTLASSVVRAEVPSSIHLQGVVHVDGAPFDGSGLFKFALVNAAGSETYWSHDGSSAAGSEPASSISLDVAIGQYAVALGDTSIAGMTTAIVPSVFDADDAHLRVWFNDGENGWQMLSPDQPIQSVGYAMKAANADLAESAASVVSGGVNLDALDLSSIDSRYVEVAGDTMTGGLTAPQLSLTGGLSVGAGAQVDQNLSVGGDIFASEIINSSGIFQLETGSDFEVLLDRQGTASSLFEIFNGADNHVFWVNENGNARVYNNLTVNGDIFASEIINSSGIFQLETGSDFEVLLDRQGSATSFFEIFNGSNEQVFWVNENGNARVYNNLNVDQDVQVGGSIFMFSGGTSNPDKPVITHSTSFPGWGLFYQDDGDRFYITSNGPTDPALMVSVGGDWVSINTDDPAAGYELSVDGQIACEELLVQNSNDWPDYVFDDDYELATLEEVEAHIEKEGRLPGIPSAAEVEAEGLSVGDMQTWMMEKIEELTLHMIEQNKVLEAQRERIEQLEARLTER